MRERETYELTCHGCERTIELPAGPANQPERFNCPHCGTELQVEWRPASSTATTAP